MALIDFFLDHPFTNGPAPLRWLSERYIDWYFEKHVHEPTFAADRAGKGLVGACWPPNTGPDAILRWYDDQLARTPRVRVMDFFRLLLVRATADEVRHSAATGSPLPADRLLAEWTGHRNDWWTEGRDHITYVLKSHTHEPLHTILNGLGRSFQASAESRRSS